MFNVLSRTGRGSRELKNSVEVVDEGATKDGCKGGGLV